MSAKRILSRYSFLRASALRMLTDDCTIYRPGSVVNEYGEDTSGFIKVADTKCHVEQLATRFLFQTPDFSRLSDLRWVIQLPWDQDVQLGDRIQVSGNRYEVEGVDKSNTDEVVKTVDTHVVGIDG